MIELPAKGTRGFLLYSPFTHDFFFRVYESDKSFTDYELRFEDMQIEIVDDHLSLFQCSPAELESTQGYNKIDYATKVLHPPPGTPMTQVHYENGERIEINGVMGEFGEFTPT